MDYSRVIQNNMLIGVIFITAFYGIETRTLARGRPF